MKRESFFSLRGESGGRRKKIFLSLSFLSSFFSIPSFASLFSLGKNKKMLCAAPNLFYVDPEIDDDPRLAGIDTVTLSYTFFLVDDGKKSGGGNGGGEEAKAASSAAAAVPAAASAG